MRRDMREFKRQLRRHLARDYRQPSARPHDPAADPHYWSTACQHNHHDDCRLACKFCDAKCRCVCHEVPA